MPGDEDIVLWILRAVVDRAPGISPNAVLEVEQVTRTHWGGSRPYVAKVPAAMRQHGFARTTLQRWEKSAHHWERTPRVRRR